MLVIRSHFWLERCRSPHILVHPGAGLGAGQGAREDGGREGGGRDATEPPPQGREPDSAVVKAAVSRALSDNFRDFSEGETDMIEHAGLTLRATIRRDKRRGLMMDPKCPVMGPSYYSVLRAVFRQSIAQLETLVCDPEDVKNARDIPRRFAEAIGITRGAHANRVDRRHHMASVTDMNETDTL